MVPTARTLSLSQEEVFAAVNAKQKTTPPPPNKKKTQKISASPYKANAEKQMTFSRRSKSLHTRKRRAQTVEALMTLAVNRHRGETKNTRATTCPSATKKKTRPLSANRLDRLPWRVIYLLVLLSRKTAKGSTTRPFFIDYRAKRKTHTHGAPPPPLPSPARSQRTAFSTTKRPNLEASNAKAKAKAKATQSGSNPFLR